MKLLFYMHPRRVTMVATSRMCDLWMIEPVFVTPRGQCDDRARPSLPDTDIASLPTPYSPSASLVVSPIVAHPTALPPRCRHCASFSLCPPPCILTVFIAAHPPHCVCHHQLEEELVPPPPRRSRVVVREPTVPIAWRGR